MNWENERKRRQDDGVNLEGATVSYALQGEEKKAPLASPSRAWQQSAYVQEKGDNGHEGDWQKLGGGVRLLGDCNELTWMLLSAATPMYRKMP